MQKAKVAILGTGNIGTDLLYKVLESDYLECALFAGRNYNSKGIELAKKLNIPVSYNSIHAIMENPDCCDIVFDATSAQAHLEHASILKKLNKFVIDLTPSKIGKMCVPVINMDSILDEPNINTVTCGGQASLPIAYAISQIHPETEYIEVVASIASKSAGPGTRANIDEFTQTTRDAISEFTGVERTKAIIILNPANPPIIMRNTIYALVENPKMEEIIESVHNYVKEIKKYVSGYRLVVEPVYTNGRLTTTVEVVGKGDFLPTYAGNLDIINCAAVKIAEEIAQKHKLV